MKRFIYALLSAGAICLMISLGGCYGSTASLNPVITFTFPDDTTLPVVAPNSVLSIKGEVSAPGEGDSIKSYHWTQQVDDPQYADYIGTFTAPNSFATTWLAPNWTLSTPLSITLKLTVDTVNGGHAVQTLNILVTRGVNPRVTFTYPNGDDLTNIHSGSTIVIDTQVTMTSQDDNMTTAFWEQESPLDYLGAFSNRETPSTTWTAPIWTGDTPLPVTLALTVNTEKGGQTVKKINLQVTK